MLSTTKINSRYNATKSLLWEDILFLQLEEKWLNLWFILVICVNKVMNRLLLVYGKPMV